MITISMSGALGNQMWQYCLIRTIAEKRGLKFFVSKEKNQWDQNISQFFPDLEMGDPGHIMYQYAEDHTKQNFDPNIFNISDGTSLWGYYQTEKYFEGYEDVIKSWFKIDKNENVKEVLDKYPIDKTCYIGFRGGDYKDTSHWYLPYSYFKLSMDKIREMGIYNFVIVTDVVEDAEEFFKNDDVVILPNPTMEDFAIMYYSKYNIIANSTFYWWATWLSNNKEIIIAPKYWLNYNKPELGFYPNDIFTKKFTYIC